MLSPIQCGGCGAPVPLAAEPRVRCRHCGEEVALPATHVALFAQATQGEAHLAQADAIWRTLPPPMPRWLPKAFVVVCVTAVIGLTVLWAVVGRTLLGGPGNSFVYLVMLPVLVGLQLGLELLAYGSPYARLVLDYSALCDPGFPEVLCCRECGAALTVRTDRVVARCAYCRVDNLVTSPKRAAFKRAHGLAREGRAQVDDAIATLRMLRTQRAVVRWVGGGVCAGVWLILAFALHGR